MSSTTLPTAKAAAIVHTGDKVESITQCQCQPFKLGRDLLPNSTSLWKVLWDDIGHKAIAAAHKDVYDWDCVKNNFHGQRGKRRNCDDDMNASIKASPGKKNGLLWVVIPNGFPCLVSKDCQESFSENN